MQTKKYFICLFAHVGGEQVVAAESLEAKEVKM